MTVVTWCHKVYLCSISPGDWHSGDQVHQGAADAAPTQPAAQPDTGAARLPTVHPLPDTAANRARQAQGRGWREGME